MVCICLVSLCLQAGIRALATMMQTTEWTKFWRCILGFGVGLVEFLGLGWAWWEPLAELMGSSV